MPAPHECDKTERIVKVEVELKATTDLVKEIRNDVKRMMFAIAVIAGASGGITGAVMSIFGK